MDPTVAAALIGVSGVVIVGVAGFGATIWTTRKTLQHARNDRLWDKRAEVYVDALAAVHYRNAKRERDMRTWPMSPDDDRQEEAFLATYTAPDWHQLEARLLAFASQPVISAAQASSTMHQRAMSAHRSHPGDEAAQERAQQARKAANGADDVLVELIRAGLQGSGPPVADWEPLRQADARKNLKSGPFPGESEAR